MNNICGLDFGTSNTISTVYQNGSTVMVPFEGNKSLPSCVFFPFKEIDNPIYGDVATNTYVNSGYGRYMKSFKRILGTPFFDQGTNLKPGTNILFHDIIVDFLKHVKKKTEAFTKKETDYVVVGRPVRLSEGGKDDDNSGIHQLESILKEVGYKNYSFLEEPIAAAYYHKKSLENKSLAIIADLGGGTCDFTIVEINNNDLSILSTSGVSIGGTDLDSYFALKAFFPELGYKSVDKFKGLALPDSPFRNASDWNKITTSLYTFKTEMLVKKMVGNAKYPEKVSQLQKLVTDKNAHSLLGEIEDTKIKLSETEGLNFNSKFIPNASNLNITKDLLENAIGNSVHKILKTSSECCKLAGVEEKAIDYLILTGGTSKTPFIKELFKETFLNAKLIENNSMDSVALGLLEKAKMDVM